MCHNYGLRVLGEEINIVSLKSSSDILIESSFLFHLVLHDLTSGVQALFESVCSQNKEPACCWYKIYWLWKCCWTVHSSYVICHNISALQIDYTCSDAPLGTHWHVILNVFGCFCWFINAQKKKNQDSVEGRVRNWKASHQEGRFLHQ